MSDEEKQDLEKLHEAMRKEKINCYDYQVELVRMPAESLKHAGHADLPSALKRAIESSMRTIKKLTDAHVRKYPD